MLYIKPKGLYLCLSLFLCLQVDHIYGQTKVIDSLKSIIAQSNNDSILMDTYNKLRRATYYSNQEESKVYTEKFLEYAEKRKDSLYIAFANFYLASSYSMENQYDKALKHFLKTLAYYEKTNDKNRMPSVINAIGSIYEKKDEYSIALSYYQRSIVMSKSTNDRRRAAIGFVNVGNVYQHLNDYQNSITALEESISLLDALRTDEPNEVSRTEQHYNIAKLNLASSYVKNNNISEAQELYKLMFSELDSIQDRMLYGYAFQGQGDLYFEIKNFKKSLKPYEKALKIFRNNNYEDGVYHIMPNLIDAYKLNKNFEKGLLLSYEYNKIKDSLFNIDKNKVLTEAMQKFEVAQKEQLLAEKNLEIEKSKSQHNLLILGLLSLAILTISLILFYRKRLKYRTKLAAQEKARLQQENKITAMDSMIAGQEQERARIAKDLHDSLGGLLSSVKSYFQASHKQNDNNEKKVVKTATLIDQAASEVRRISHNMMPHALTIAGLKDAITDIAERLEAEKYGVTLEIHELPKFDTTQEIMIYRLIQELVYNIKKHAQASSVFIQLYTHNDRVHLTVEDDGQGFELEQAKNKKGLGLESIQSRVAYLNGEVLWDSEPSKGTTVNISFAA